MNTKHVTDKQLKILAEKAAEICFASGNYDSLAQVKEHVEFNFDSTTRKTWKANAYLNQIVSDFAKNVSISPSQESREWSNMEGGHVLWDDSKGEQIARKLCAELGIELKH